MFFTGGVIANFANELNLELFSKLKVQMKF